MVFSNKKKLQFATFFGLLVSSLFSKNKNNAWARYGPVCVIATFLGEIINEKDRCKKCSGAKTVKEQKIIEVNITPGMRDNQKIVFYGEGDHEPGIEPGDVVLVIKTKPHEQFDRKGDDLYMKK